MKKTHDKKNNSYIVTIADDTFYIEATNESADLLSKVSDELERLNSELEWEREVKAAHLKVMGERKRRTLKLIDEIEGLKNKLDSIVTEFYEQENK